MHFASERGCGQRWVEEAGGRRACGQRLPRASSLARFPPPSHWPASLNPGSAITSHIAWLFAVYILAEWKTCMMRMLVVFLQVYTIVEHVYTLVWTCTLFLKINSVWSIQVHSFLKWVYFGHEMDTIFKMDWSWSRSAQYCRTWMDFDPELYTMSLCPNSD